MRRRYLVAWSPASLRAVRIAAVEALARSHGLIMIHRTSRMIVAADPRLPALPAGPNGLIVGTIIDRGGRAPLGRLDQDDGAAIARTRGAALCQRYWGSYLALLPDGENSLDLIRAPLGDLGVCVAQDALSWLVASDARLIASAAEQRFPIDFPALARHLAAPELVGAETCLAGINDVRGGDRLTLRAGSSSISTLWSPWQIALAPPRTDQVEATQALRGAVRWAVTASTASYDRALVFLSGGLDSSIVAACLSESGSDWSGLNMVTADPIGDERDYARATAEALGGDLQEVMRDPSGIDFTLSLASALPRPLTRAFNQESERLAFNEAMRVSADVLVDGSGGDNVFCSHRSVAATADCLLSEGYGPRYRATAHALGDLTGAALPRILLQSVRRGWLRPAARAWATDTRFLAPHFAAIADARAAHPWYQPPAGVPPGRALHVSLLAAAQALNESGSAAQPIDRLSPLISQPVAEACLSVPPWMWYAPGHDRALARRAFANRLPRLVLDRRTKGTPSPFIAAILADRRPALRSYLLDGVLSSSGFVDSDALRHQLDDLTPPPGVDVFPRLLGIIDAEAWARCWS